MKQIIILAAMFIAAIILWKVFMENPVLGLALIVGFLFIQRIRGRF